ncbi:uncharacterized protein [Henckelia pumila]|uniref:uncharacterized protein n=1 Tax=Henckelia pumila TaxID=405737 RepID=UPI003C6E9E32
MSFFELKERFITTRVLVIREGIGRFAVYTDAFNSGLGAVLIQDDQMMAYAPRQMKVHERNYPTHDFELVAIAFALKLGNIICMSKDIVNFVNECLKCQQVKAEHRRPAGLPKLLSIPTWNWEDVTIDFMVGFPVTPQRMNSIWVIVDRLNNSAHFLPVMTNFSMS